MNRSLMLISSLAMWSCAPWSNAPAVAAGAATPLPTEVRGDGACPATVECAPPVEPELAPPALTGGNLAAAPDGSWVVADGDRAILWHLGATSELGRASLSPNELPGRVLVHAGRAFVVLRRSNQLAELDLATHTLTRRSTCAEPRGLAARGDELLVGCVDGTIEAHSLWGARRTLLRDDLLVDLRDLEVDGDRLLVSTFRNAQVFEVREGTAPRVLGNPLKPADATGRRFVPRVAWRMRAGLVVAQEEQVNVLPAAYYSPPPEVDGGIVSAALFRVEGQRVVPLPGSSRVVLPVDVAESGGAVFVLSAGTDELFRLEPGSGAETRLALPGSPTSLAASDGTIAVFVREPAQLLTFSAQGALQSTLLLDAPSVFSTSHQLFHRAAPSGVACASCHPEAGEDGHTWIFSNQPRRTPSLRGALSSTAPFHWDGREADLAALMADVMVRRMGGRLQSAARNEALARWLDAQAALQPPTVDALSAARGRALFDSSEVGCASCHSGEQGTDNTSVNVGTGGVFQVPRLRELAWRAPYFHDGRVENLEARFLPNAGGDLHGQVSQLNAQQRADLVEYLKTR